MPDIVLETVGLTKSFRGRRVVDHLDLRVHEGDVFGFLGPNGAGKSTTIRMITGLVHPESGSARLLGTDVGRDRKRALGMVGALVESPALYKYMSARENLRLLGGLSGPCDGRRIDEVLETVGLLDRANDKVKTYSQGMRQRLGIAQALLPRPRLIILDEPTNGLDPQGMKDVRELVARLTSEEKMTVFISSHLLHEVEQICTRVAIINKGKLIAQGAVDELLRTESDVVEIAANDTAAAARAISEVKDCAVLETPADANGSLLVRAPVDRTPALTRALVAAGVDIYEIARRRSTLEDLFLEMTGEAANVG